MRRLALGLAIFALLALAALATYGLSGGNPRPGQTAVPTYGRHYLAVAAGLHLDNGQLAIAPDGYVQVEALQPLPETASFGTQIRVRVISTRTPSTRDGAPHPQVGQVGTVDFGMLD